MRIVVAAVLAGGLCSSLDLAAAEVARVTLADVGLEGTSLDRTVDPCVDFYQFACGGWLKANPIPADRAVWGRFDELEERTTTALTALLDSAARGTQADPSLKKLGDFYGSCIDEAAIEAAGVKPLQALLAKTTKVKDARSWMAAVTALHSLGIFVAWDESAAADFQDSKNSVTYLDAGRLGLPDRDYYVKPAFADKVAAYQVHVERMLAIAPLPPLDPKKAAADVVAVETELAKLAKTAVERRDLAKMYNPTTIAALEKQAPHGWRAYWKAVGHTPSKRIVVTTPAYLPQLAKLRTRIPAAQWAAYFTYHALAAHSISLPRAYDQTAFELQKELSGVEQQRPRAKRCVDETSAGLGELLGQQYVAKYFPSSARQTAVNLIDAIVKAMDDQIAILDWMSPATKQVAQAKLAKIARMIGYPDRWRLYDFEVKRDDFAGNRMRARAAETKRLLSRAGKPVDRSEWQMQTFEVNAYYDPTANTTALPAGILQHPFFGPDRSAAANLGGIGLVIGHELTHGFDDQGAGFDADGNMKSWWAGDDATRFGERAACVSAQFDTYEAAKGQFVQGALTLGENIADLGGVKMAFHAYRALRADATKTYVADGFSEDQQFFLGVAQAWCTKVRPAEVQRRLTTDPHAPPKFRVYGALRNLAAFSSAFKCAAGTPMNPAKTCSVW